MPSRRRVAVSTCSRHVRRALFVFPLKAISSPGNEIGDLGPLGSGYTRKDSMNACEHNQLASFILRSLSGAPQGE